MEFRVEESSRQAAEAFALWRQPQMEARSVRGDKMWSLDRLFDETAAALQFPWYFGENPAAFDECIADLSWMPSVGGYAILIRNAQSVLRDQEDWLSWFVGALDRAAAAWTAAGSVMEVVLHFPPQNSSSDILRWGDAGAQLRPLT